MECGDSAHGLEGKAVPEIRTMKSENLFPHFTTLRRPADGDLWFPVKTYADVGDGEKGAA